jgi:NAD(P)H-flavin reductase
MEGIGASLDRSRLCGGESAAAERNRSRYDAYLSGPPGMIRSGVDVLRRLGIPSERIRHDSVEELVAAGI